MAALPRKSNYFSPADTNFENRTRYDFARCKKKKRKSKCARPRQRPVQAWVDSAPEGTNRHHRESSDDSLSGIGTFAGGITRESITADESICVEERSRYGGSPRSSLQSNRVRPQSSLPVNRDGAHGSSVSGCGSRAITSRKVSFLLHSFYIRPLFPVVGKIPRWF